MLKNRKNNRKDIWQSGASLKALQARAELLSDIRAFFRKRKVLEIETPLMCQTAATDPHLQPIPVGYFETPGKKSPPYFLQTSPEFAMKRLLADGSGPIYQICKAFRNGEVGKMHNPEFTLLEWYRPGFSHHQLMDEMDDFLNAILGTQKATRISYQQLFLKNLGFDPLTITLKELRSKAEKLGIRINRMTADSLNSDDWLNLILTHSLEPKMGVRKPLFVYDFPASQAALAKIRPENPPVGERFEVFIKGVELANGYHELTDFEQQLNRFQDDCLVRDKLGAPKIPIDLRLIAALKSGLPDCAGVALGVDRLLMLKLKSQSIEDVISFTIKNA